MHCLLDTPSEVDPTLTHGTQDLTEMIPSEVEDSEECVHVV